jgi:hypothetical protein
VVVLVADEPEIETPEQYFAGLLETVLETVTGAKPLVSASLTMRSTSRRN